MPVVFFRSQPLVSIARRLLIEYDVSILKQESPYGRLRYTLAHNLSYCFLHKGLFIDTGIAAKLYKYEVDEDTTE